MILIVIAIEIALRNNKDGVGSDLIRPRSIVGKRAVVPVAIFYRERTILEMKYQRVRFGRLNTNPVAVKDIVRQV